MTGGSRGDKSESRKSYKSPQSLKKSPLAVESQGARTRPARRDVRAVTVAVTIALDTLRQGAAGLAAAVGGGGGLGLHGLHDYSVAL